MTDINTGLKEAEQAAKSTALNAVNKQETWFKANRKAFLLGAAVAFTLVLVAKLIFGAL